VVTSTANDPAHHLAGATFSLRLRMLPVAKHFSLSLSPQECYFYMAVQLFEDPQPCDIKNAQHRPVYIVNTPEMVLT
jgi:hypothetical protein